jgi:hypothetical protein
MGAPDFGGWYKNGGSATFRRPTMVGVGDGQATGGSETISVTRNAPGARAGKAGTGTTVAVNMNFGDVHVGSGEDFEKIVEKAAERVGEKILEELERV